MPKVETLPPLVPDEAEYLGAFKPRQELGVNFDERFGVAYLDAPMHVFMSTKDGVDRFDAVPDHPALHGEQLLWVLNAIAPQKSQFIIGILEDWKVIDQASHGNGEANRLVSLHEHLGAAWNEFINRSRPAFMNVLEDGNASFLYAFTGYESEPTITVQETVLHSSVDESEVAEQLRRNAPKSLDAVVKFFVEGGVEAPREFVLEAMRKQVNYKQFKRNMIIRPETIDKRFGSWHVSRRGALLMGLIDSLSEDERSAVLSAAATKVVDNIIGEDGAVYFPKVHFVRKPMTEVDGTVVERSQGKFACNVFVASDQVKASPREHVVAGSLRRLETGPTMSPHLAWTRDGDGKRQFVLEQSTEVVAGGEEGDLTHTRDGLLGALMVAYLSPQITETWPKSRGLPGAKHTQFMGPAQVPVLALMFKERLLKSPLVEASERLAGRVAQ